MRVIKGEMCLLCGLLVFEDGEDEENFCFKDCLYLVFFDVRFLRWDVVVVGYVENI